MGSIPTPRSYNQQLGDIIAAFLSRSGIKTLQVGDPLLSMLEAAAQSDIRQSQDVFNGLASIDLDNAEDAALDRIGNSEGVPRRLLAKTTGEVTVIDSSFTKLSSAIYHGAAAPIIGSVTLNVDSTVGWPSSGSVYVGRRTVNVEGPLSYTSITNNGSFQTLNLSSPTTRFHNLGEEVVLAQGGNRVVDAGQIVATAQGALTAAVQFATVFNATIPDGETEVSNVDVVATVPGAQGNVPALSVKEFSGGLPFSGATVVNPTPFVTGRDTETNIQYRDRIRQARNSKQRATDLAITNAVIGAISPDENKRVTSASVVRTPGQPARLFIDDGSGYEETSTGVGIEVVVDSASGGEPSFQTLQRPVVKAFLVSRNVAPFALVNAGTLSINVGGVTTTHTFQSSDFNAINAASAYEITASINANPALLWSARTAGSGSQVVIFARAETNEDLVVAPAPDDDIDVQSAFLFPVSRQFTMLLYRNDRLLTKDGSVASIRSLPFAGWSAFSGPQTLIVAVDQTPATTYAFVDQNFVDANTGFTAVGKNSLQAWAAVINRVIPGVVATVEGDRVILTSNRGRSNDAAVVISGGSLISQFAFEADSAFGANFDYSLDRGTGQFATVVPLNAGDRLTLGSIWTRAFLETAPLAPFGLASDVDTWWSIDGGATIVPHGVGSATPLSATVANVTEEGHLVKVTATSTSEVFADVLPGDWAILWDPAVPTSLRRAWRVASVNLVTGLKNAITLEKRASAAPRADAAACTLAPAGGNLSQVLVTGGYARVGAGVTGKWSFYGTAVTDECEIYDPNTGTWAGTGAMSAARAHHTATLLQNGQVFVAGGFGKDGVALDTTEVWDPGTGLWTAGPTLPVAVGEHSAILLNNGRVLIAGGNNNGTAVANSVEYDPGSNTFINAQTMGTARWAHGAVLLPTGAGVAGAEAGNVLVVGGVNGTFTLASAERYNSGTPGWSPKTGMGAGNERGNFGLAVAATQKVLAVGDTYNTAFSSDQDETYQVYSVDTDSWTSPAVVEAGFQFTNKRNGAIKCATNNAVICYGGTFVVGGIKSLRHKRFDGGALTWSTLAASPFASAGVEREAVSGVALTGGTSPDRVWFYGGVSAGNTSANDTSGHTVATAETWNDDSSAWEALDDAINLLNTTLGNRGLTFVRATTALEHAVIPAGTDYTASTLGTAINDALDGLTAAVYRTIQLRVQTNSYALGDDILLAAATDPALPIPVGETDTNVVGHFASVQATSGLGTPADFVVQAVVGTADIPHAVGMAETVFLAPTVPPPPYAGTLVGLKRWRDGLNPRWWAGTWTPGSDPTLPEYGNTKGASAVIGALDLQGSPVDRTRLGLRRLAISSWAPSVPAVLALPYAVGPRDDLTVVIDEDEETKRFSVPMFRNLKPTTTSYSTQITVQDTDGGAVTLAKSFGIDYDFNDFALYMKARAKSHSADATRRVLWRFFRHGPEGEFLTMRYTYPTAPNATVAVNVDYTQNSDPNDLGGPIRVFANVVLNSGAARTGNTLSTTSRIGLARVNGSFSTAWDVYVLCGYQVIEAQRTAPGGLTRLRIQMPNNGVVANAPSASGITPGTILWFQATAPSPTTLFSGVFAVDSVGTFNVGTGQQDIFVPGSTLDDGTSAMGLTSNPGTLSFNPTGLDGFDPATTAGDLLYLTPGDLPIQWTGTTMRVLASGPTYIIARSLDLTVNGIEPTVTLSPLLNTADFVLFQGPTQTANQIVTTVNALGGDAGISPISGTVVGSGSGVISQATWDELNNHTGGYPLADGLNYVQETIIPGSVFIDTQFVLRAPITADLQTNSDWINEDVRLVPVMVEDVVSWFNTPAVTGLDSVAETAAAADGTSVQIASLQPGSAGSVEVQGGSATLTTAAVFGSSVLLGRNIFEPVTMVTVVRRAEADGLIGGRWVRADNASGVPKSPFWIDTTTAAVTAAGVWTFGVPPYTLLSSTDEVHVEVERVGQFVALHLPLTENQSVPTLAECPEFGYVYVTAPTLNRSDLPAVGTANTGVFRIVRTSLTADALTIWIENSNAVDQAAVCKLKTLDADSSVAGDKWVVSTAGLNAGNQGTWLVTEVGTSSPGGEQYVASNFTVDITSKSPSVRGSAVLGAASSFLQLIAVPARLFKKIVTITPNQADPTFVDVQFDTAPGYAAVTSAAGTVLTAMDKFAFPTGVFVGVDGYRYGTGLLHEANKIVYGDPADEDLYPGFAATGGQILVQGPTVKRIGVTLSLRVQSGLASDDLADRVRSAVATVINQGPVGQAIPISSLVDAASEVGGVIAVAVVKPIYSSTSDIIPVGAGEKPLVLDLRTDIKIVFVGA